MFYETIELEKNEAVCVCKRCRHKITHPYMKADSSNSNLWKHYCKHNNRCPSPQTNQLNIDALLSWATGIMTIDFQRLLLQMMIICNWSFDQFDNATFRHLLVRDFLGQKILGRIIMHRLLTSTAQKAKDEIKERFGNHDGRISLALTCWTSSNRWEFMSMTSSPLLHDRCSCCMH